MGKKVVNRIDVFGELIETRGAFDFEKCEKILGDHYSSFVNFCQAIKLIPEDINTMTIVSTPDTTEKNKPTQFLIELANGEIISLEK